MKKCPFCGADGTQSLIPGLPTHCRACGAEGPRWKGSLYHSLESLDEFNAAWDHRAEPELPLPNPISLGNP